MNSDLLISNILAYDSKKTFYREYDFDIWFTIIVFFLVLIFILKHISKGIAKSQKNNWSDNKCNPAYMPFGKYITEDEDKNFNANNFNNCINDSLHSIASQVFDPIKAGLFSISSFFSFIAQLFFKIIIMLKWIFSLIKEIFLFFLNYFRAIIEALIDLFRDLEVGVSNLLSFFTILYYTFQFLVKTLLYIFFIFAFGFLLVVCVPAIVGMVISLILLIIFSVLCYVLCPVPLLFGATCPSCVGAAIQLVVFIITLAFMIFVLVIYSNIKDFAEKTVPDAVNEQPVGDDNSLRSNIH